MLRYIIRQIRRYFGKDKTFYSAIYSTLGIVPDNIELYKLAMIHRSASVVLPDRSYANNERLEFLGDAVLDTIVTDYLFIEYPDANEGTLTQLRARIVSRASLDSMAESIGLKKMIVASFNDKYTNKHIHGNALEALIGAIYLDKGYNYTNRFVIKHLLGEHIDLVDVSLTESDFKSRLIEWCQKSKRTIHFNTVHDTDFTVQHPKFVSTIMIDNIELGYGRGESKKEAEQQAAGSVMQLMNDEVGDTLLEALDKSIEKLPDGKIN